MRQSRLITAAAMLMVVAISPVVPAMAQDTGPAAADQTGPTNTSAAQDQITLRRDGDRAEPFDPAPGGGVPVLRRDGSGAVPFVAQVGPEASPANSGFDWGAAMIGAGAAYGLILLGLGTLVLIRRIQPHLRHADAPTQVASQ